MCGFANHVESVTALHCVEKNEATANLSGNSELKRLISAICHVPLQVPCFLTAALLAFGRERFCLCLTVPWLSGCSVSLANIHQMANKHSTHFQTFPGAMPSLAENHR